MRQVTRVRLLIGDTDTARQQLQDEEIAYVLYQQPVVNYAGADCADILAAKYAFQVSTVNGALRITASQRQEQYAALAKRLRANGPGDTAGGVNGGAILAEAYVGGLSKGENEEYREDSDNVLPSISVGQDDFPETPETATNYFSDDV